MDTDQNLVGDDGMGETLPPGSSCPCASTSSPSSSYGGNKRRRVQGFPPAPANASTAVALTPIATASYTLPPPSPSLAAATAPLLVMRIPGRGGGPKGGRKVNGKSGGGGGGGGGAGGDYGSAAVKGSRANGGRARPATRARHSTILTPADQEGTEAALARTLRSMGLYAAKTQGDGNCMFRALSDQLYGHDGRHAALRREVCDHIAARKSAYAGFVDTERPFEDYVRAMRERGTYGGHMELTAFARLKRRSIKVILPDYVYVVAGTGEAAPDALEDPRLGERLTEDEPGSNASTPAATTTNDTAADEDSLEPDAMLYLSYHIFEHYSSVRNLAGPHKGLPRVTERDAAGNPVPSSEKTSTPSSSTRTYAGGLSLEKRHELIFNSLPPHVVPSTTKVHDLLESNAGDWEKVVEILIEEDVAEAQVEEGLVVADSASEASGGSPPQDAAVNQSPHPPGVGVSVPALMLYRDGVKPRGGSPFTTSDDVETNTSASDGFATPVGADGESVSPAASQATDESGSAPPQSGTSAVNRDAKASRPGSGRKRQLTSTSVVADCRIKTNPAETTIAKSEPRTVVKALGRNLPKVTSGTPMRGKEKRDLRKAARERTRRERIEAESWGAAAPDSLSDKRVTRGMLAKGTNGSDSNRSTDKFVTTTSHGLKELHI